MYENYSKAKKYIGQTIKIYRIKVLKLSQIEMCEKLDISQGCLSKVETGRTELALLSFFKLLDLLNISSYEFNESVKLVEEADGIKNSDYLAEKFVEIIERKSELDKLTPVNNSVKVFKYQKK